MRRALLVVGRYFLVLTLVLTLAPARARGCGVSAGSAVGVSSCSLEEHQEAVRPKWRVGAGFGFASTSVKFGDMRFEQTRGSALATLDYAPLPRWTFEAGAGALLFGELVRDGVSYELRPGVLALLGASWRVLDVSGARPFVLLQNQLAFVAASTRAPGEPAPPSVDYTAFDLRLGALVGWTFKGVVSPYALARVFGGPIFWQYQGDDVTGTDVYHYQLGAGLVVKFARHFDLSLEGIALGEQGFSVAAGGAF